MTTNYPTSLDSFTTHANGDTIEPEYDNNQQDAIVALQTKLGVDNSAATTTIDYKLKSTSSLDPGHKHTPTVSLAITGTPDGTKYLRDDNTWSQPPTVADASTTVKGSAKTSVAPASASDPIVVGDNDPRVPTTGENDALAGTSGTPSNSNRYVTADDVATAATASKVVRRLASGDITVPATPTNSTDAVSKSYADSTKSNASASISGSGITTTQNIDTAVTMGTTPKVITVNFWLKGFSGSGTSTYSIGTAYFDGATIKSYFSPLYQSTSTTISATTYAVGDTSPQAGDGGAANGTWGMSIQSVSSTGFTFRLTYTQGSTFNGGDYKCTVSATA